MKTTYEQIFDLLNKEGLIDKELNFGCEIIFNDGLASEKLIIVFNEEELLKTVFKDISCIGPVIEEKLEKEKYKIIGHPPVITDILRYLDKNSLYDFYHISKQGILWKHITKEDTDKNILMFNLSKPLNQQTKITLQKLLSLMKEYE